MDFRKDVIHELIKWYTSKSALILPNLQILAFMKKCLTNLCSSQAHSLKSLQTHGLHMISKVHVFNKIIPQ